VTSGSLPSNASAVDRLRLGLMWNNVASALTTPHSQARCHDSRQGVSSMLRLVTVLQLPVRNYPKCVWDRFEVIGRHLSS
jgi:hypothetical protein